MLIIRAAAEPTIAMARTGPRFSPTGSRYSQYCIVRNDRDHKDEKRGCPGGTRACCGLFGVCLRAVQLQPTWPFSARHDRNELLNGHICHVHGPCSLVGLDTPAPEREDPRRQRCFIAHLPSDSLIDDCRGPGPAYIASSYYESRSAPPRVQWGLWLRKYRFSSTTVCAGHRRCVTVAVVHSHSLVPRCGHEKAAKSLRGGHCSAANAYCR